LRSPATRAETHDVGRIHPIPPHPLPLHPRAKTRRAPGPRKPAINLGVYGARKPAINLDGLGSAFASQEQFVAAARALEDITVSAYVSLLPVLQSKAYLSVLVRLLGDEAEHAANMRLHTALYNVTCKPVHAADIVAPPSGTLFISSDSNGLVAIRTPTQVLYYAFGMQANSTSGGFFPAGVNGSITASSAAATPS